MSYIQGSNFPVFNRCPKSMTLYRIYRAMHTFTSGTSWVTAHNYLTISMCVIIDTFSVISTAHVTLIYKYLQPFNIDYTHIKHAIVPLYNIDPPSVATLYFEHPRVQSQKQPNESWKHTLYIYCVQIQTWVHIIQFKHSSCVCCQLPFSTVPLRMTRSVCS